MVAGMIGTVVHLKKKQARINNQVGNSIDSGHYSGHFWGCFSGHFLPYGIVNVTTVVCKYGLKSSPKCPTLEVDAFQMALWTGFWANFGAIFRAKIILLNCHSERHAGGQLPRRGADGAHLVLRHPRALPPLRAHHARHWTQVHVACKS